MLAEALILFFDAADSAALDRIRRSSALALAMADMEGAALSLAWRCHFEFNFGTPIALGDALQSFFARQYCTAEIAERIGLVLGNAFLHCGDRESARCWYQLARLAAVAEVDDAGLGALMYNRAAIGVTHLLVMRALDSGLDMDSWAVYLAEVESGFNYQQGTRIDGLADLTNQSLARMQLLKGHYGDALAILRALRESPVRTISEASVLGEIAFCQAKLGTLASDPSVLRAAESCMPPVDADDRLLHWSNLCACYTALDEPQQVAAMLRRKELATEQYRSNQEELRRVIAQYSDIPEFVAAGAHAVST